MLAIGALFLTHVSLASDVGKTDKKHFAEQTISDFSELATPVVIVCNLTDFVSNYEVLIAKAASFDVVVLVNEKDDFKSNQYATVESMCRDVSNILIKRYDTDLAGIEPIYVDADIRYSYIEPLPAPKPVKPFINRQWKLTARSNC